MTELAASSLGATQGDAPVDGAGPEDWARPILERQLSMLGELAEIGLNLARAIERRAASATADMADGEALAVLEQAGPVYDRVARSVRLSILLRSKLVGDIKALDDGTALVSLERKQRVQRIVNRVIDAETGDLRAAGRFTREAQKRLDHDDIYGDVMTLPVSELVARICKDLGLAPDWAELAQQAWAQEEVAGGAVGSPLAEWMAGLSGRPTAAADPPERPPRAASP